MQRNCRPVVLLAMMLIAGALLLPGVSRAGGTSFADLTTSPYRRAVETLRQAGVVSGRTPEIYAPDEPVTRAEMAVLLVRVARPEWTGPTSPTSFTDVPADHWAAPAVGRASELGWIRGAEGRFRPDDPVTQEEALTMVIRAAGHATGVTGTWPDSYIAKASLLGLLTEFPFVRGAGLKRGEAAQLLYNWIMNVPASATGLTLNQSVYKVPAALAITPESHYLTENRVTVRVSVTDATGRPLEVAAKVSAEGGALDGDTLVVHEDSQVVTVRAELGELVVTRTYTVLSGLCVVPDRPVTWPGKELALAATLGDGRPAPNVSWTADEGATVTPQGTFVTARPGVYTVTAVAEGLSAHARVLVAQDLVVTPAEVLAAPGVPVRFEAHGRVGTETGPVGPAEWRVQGLLGVMDNHTGVFTASAASSGTITAKVGEMVASATVKVTGRPSRLSASFDRARVAADGVASATLTVRLLDDHGLVVPVNGRAITVEASGVPVDMSVQSLLTDRGVAHMTVKAGTTEGVARFRLSTDGLPLATANLTVGRQIAAGIRLQVLPDRIWHVFPGSPAIVTATVVDVLNQPVIATEDIHLRLIAEPKPVPPGGYGKTVGTLTIPKGAIGGITTAYLSMDTSFVNGLTVWGIDDTKTTAEPITNRVSIAITGWDSATVTLRVVPAFLKAPADGMFKVPVIFMALDRHGVLTHDGMGNAVFQVTGPGGEGEVVAESLWELAVFELPPQSVPGTYTVTEKSSAVEPFTIEFFAVDP